MAVNQLREWEAVWGQPFNLAAHHTARSALHAPHYLTICLINQGRTKTGPVRIPHRLALSSPDRFDNCFDLGQCPRTRPRRAAGCRYSSAAPRASPSPTPTNSSQPSNTKYAKNTLSWPVRLGRSLPSVLIHLLYQTSWPLPSRSNTKYATNKHHIMFCQIVTISTECFNPPALPDVVAAAF
ncbi:hypothetical protein J6590_073035 [Homalodisca vitripennis]|nr:hypothetical protein J6590_073035 [Homalodisca vitripennis]